MRVMREPGEQNRRRYRMPHEVDEPQGPHRDTPCGLMPIFRRGHRTYGRTRFALPIRHRMSAAVDHKGTAAPAGNVHDRRTDMTRTGRSEKRKLGPAGFEPATKGLCVPLRLSPPLSSLWAGPSLHFTCLPSGLYTFCLLAAWLGIGTLRKKFSVPRI